MLSSVIYTVFSGIDLAVTLGDAWADPKSVFCGRQGDNWRRVASPLGERTGDGKIEFFT